MRVAAVLNRNGGALRGLDTAALAGEIEAVFRSVGHSIDVKLADGGDLVPLMRAAAADPSADVLLAGGGDGTISLAAGLVAGTDKALGVLPAGTMNLFARSLDIPLQTDAAIAALSTGRIRRVDIARANGRCFVHQFSIGMHSKLIGLRERMEFHSRLGKMMASTRAALAMLIRPPSLHVRLDMGEAQIRAVTSNLAVTNNLYGEGRSLPFADRPDGGQLGIYITRARKRRDLIWHFLNMGIGRWQANDQVEIHQATEVTVAVGNERRRFRCAIDGELCPLATETRIELLPGALAVLVPDDG